MIYYYSGTGNSAWTAREIARLTGDTAVDMRSVQPGEQAFTAQDTLGLVFPVYAWAPPQYVLTFAAALKPNGAYTFAVCTYGAEAGDTMGLLARALPLDSAFGLVMPNNYVVGSNPDSEQAAAEKIAAARLRLPAISAAVAGRERKFDVHRGVGAVFKYLPLYKLFNRFGRSTKRFYAGAACDGCGLCARICPAQAISMRGDKPSWQGSCHLCLGCINRCPQRAIEYGKSTLNRGRYYFPAGEELD